MKKIILIIAIAILSELNLSELTLLAQLSPIVDGRDIGYIDSLGKVMIPCEYDGEVEYELFSMNGKTIIDFRIPSWAKFSGGAFTIKIPKKYLFYTHSFTYCLFDDKGNKMIEPSEDVISNLVGDIAIYKKLYKNFQKVYDFDFSYVNIKSKNNFAEKFSLALPYSDALALVITKENEIKYIDTNGQKAFAIDMTQLHSNEIQIAESFSEGLAAVKVDEQYGFIDKKGKWAILPNYEYAYNFSNGFARVFNGKQYGFVDKKGKMLTGFYYSFADNFSEGLALVKVGEKYGYIDTNGKEIIPCIFVYAQPFSEGLAAVYNNGGISFINKEGGVAINTKLDYTKGFQYGLAKVWKNDEMYYINKKGETVYTILTKSQYKNKRNSMAK
jgi:hypothetical protein